MARALHWHSGAMTDPSIHTDRPAVTPRASLVPTVGGVAGGVALGAAAAIVLPELLVSLTRAADSRAAALAWAVVGVTAVAASALVVRVRRERDEARAALARWRDGELRRRDVMDYVLHDMKGPITALYHVAELVVPERGRPDDAAAVVREATESLRRMVFNLLDLNRAADGALATHRRPVDIALLLASAQESASRAGRLRAARVELDARLGDARVDGDEEVLARVLDNLLTNAIKYSRADAVITLSAHARDGAVEVRVVDAAPAIPEASRAAIFEKYARLDRDVDRLRAVSHGLGLAFCREAVRAHGGELWVEPGARGGNAFVLRLPTRRA